MLSVTVSEIKIDIPKHLQTVRSDPFWTFAASEWHRLYAPFVPMDTGQLLRQVNIVPGQITHTAPYARYIYHGEIYGPNYPIRQGGRVVGYYSPRGRRKHPTGRRMRFRNPQASARWDKAAEPTQRGKLIAAMQGYADRRLNFNG